MSSRQTTPEHWLIVDRPIGPQLWEVVRKLPRGSGVLLIHQLDSRTWRRLRSIAKLRSYVLATEAGGGAARVHDMRELTHALLRRPCLVLVSPLHPTRSHRDWKPLHRMRAAALARLCRRSAIALGGMNASRFARITGLGFSAWAGISAFKT